jgi:hypothetical protein
MKQRSNNHGSSVNDWATPQHIKDYIVREFGEYFDPCPLRSEFDGLIIDWKPINYINPPYSQKLKEAFIMKALEESKKGAICIMLIPASTDTKIFHKVIIPNGVVKLIEGRVKFKGYNSKNEYVENKAGQSGSMLVIFGTTEKPNIAVLSIN